jgi:phosphoesterase RecJ-like protein
MNVSSPDPHSPRYDVLAAIAPCSRFVVTSHARPDGDAIGSALGMMHLLRALGKQVTVAFADPIPQIYRALPGAEGIVSALPPADSVDAAVLLECDSVERTGYARIDAPIFINVDHHLSGKPFADVNWIDPAACAVGEMVYQLGVAAKVDISPEMAICLYAAVLTDTGSFTFSCTNADTFAVAQHLLESGANASTIAREVYFSNPASKVRLLGKALGHLEVEGAIAWAWVTADDMEQASADVEDCEGVVNHLIGIADVQAAVFLRQVPESDEFRLSIRSKGVLDVASVAEKFGGGGHRYASGCSTAGPLHAAIDRIVGALRAALAATA